MIFKWGSKEPISSIKVTLAELVLIEIETIIDNIELIANDFNNFTNLCFRNVFNLLLVLFQVFLHI